MKSEQKQKTILKHFLLNLIFKSLKVVIFFESKTATYKGLNELSTFRSRCISGQHLLKMSSKHTLPLLFLFQLKIYIRS